MELQKAQHEKLIQEPREGENGRRRGLGLCQTGPWAGADALHKGEAVKVWAVLGSMEARKGLATGVGRTEI